MHRQSRRSSKSLAVIGTENARSIRVRCAIIMQEYDIGELVLHIDKFDNKKIFGLITDKREDDGTITYSIDWADDYRDDNYNEREVEIYVNNARKYA